MFLRMIYDDGLAQAAYLIGCQATGEAIVFDPERDVDRYVDVARAQGLRLTAAAETHIHADFLSGARELAERGATVYLPGQGGPEWSYRWPAEGSAARPSQHRPVRDGDAFRVGAIEFRVLHTPGHTPEHVCYLVTDRGAGAEEPMGIITGDFVFVGDVGRPDLLESAVGRSGAAEPAARDLFRSARRFAELPEYLQVWPAHGAGSACGKALGAVPQSTVGYEKRFNSALRFVGGAGRGGDAAEREFVGFVLAGQPEPPAYFARMKRLNRDGPPVVGTPARPPQRSAADLASLDARRVALVDTRAWAQFMAGHVPGSLYLPLNSSFSTDAGSFIRPEEEIVLIVEAGRVMEAVRALIRVGLDNVRGWGPPEAIEAYRAGGGRLETAPEIDAGTAGERLRRGGATALDVRRASEFVEGHAPGARNVAHTRLIEHVAELPRSGPVIVNCLGGGRSARACAFLRRQGYDAINVAGGFRAWEMAGLPVERAGGSGQSAG